MNLNNISSSLSFDSKHSDNEAYRAWSSNHSDEGNLSLEMENFVQANKNSSREGLDHVDEDNDNNYKLLSNYLKKQENYASEEDNDSKYSPTSSSISPVFIITYVITWIWISISIWFTKYMFSNSNMTVWEDIYGKVLVGSVLSYIMMTVKKTSPFDIPLEIRNRLYITQTWFVLAFWFTMISLQYLSALSVWAVLLNFYWFREKLFLSFAIFGMVILANPVEIFASNVDNIIPVILIGIALWWLIVSKILMKQVKLHISLTVGIFLFNFSTMLTIPLFIIIAFSIQSANIGYGIFEIVYFILNGVITWLGIHFFIQTIRIDKANRYELLCYSSIIYIWIYQLIYYLVNDAETSLPACESPIDSTEIIDQNTPSEQTKSADQLWSYSLGIWEYIAILIMIGFRCAYCIWKFKIALKDNQDKQYKQNIDSVSV